MPLGSRCGQLLLLLGQWPAPAAFPSYRTRIPMGTRVACFPGAKGCSDGNAAMGEPASVCHGLGHSTCSGGSLPLNPFGQALEAAGLQWTQELCQADSDGDGQTNGQELGDPCCQWSFGAAESPYMKGFNPSHPGHAASNQGDAYVAPACGSDTAPGSAPVRTAAFAPGEEQRHVDFRIRSYKIPRVKTDYVSFVFNFRDNDHPVYHIVFGEALVDQPDHLHHFIIYGCTQHVPAKLEGVPIKRDEDAPKYCAAPVGGYSAWGPGGTVWDSPMSAGVPIGEGARIVGFLINVHFSDGDRRPGAISRDAFRIHYTPDLRSKTLDFTNMLYVSQNPSMVIPPGAERWFVTRTCKVEDSCQDADERTARGILFGRTCKQLAAATMCAHPKIGRMIASVCPKSCGLNHCYALADEDALPLSAVWFHGHQLAKEMYLTHTRDGETTNLGSTSVWHIKDQATLPLYSHNLSLKVGDVIQSTCVYNSQSRSKNTVMGHSSDDEMCIVSAVTLRRTTRGRAPPAAFSCKGDAWSGQLAHGEDALRIADMHPVTRAKAVWSPGKTVESGGDTNSWQRLPTRLCPVGSEARPSSCRRSGKPDKFCCARKSSASCGPDRAGRKLELVWGEACLQEGARTSFGYMCCTPAEPPRRAAAAAPSASAEIAWPDAADLRRRAPVAALASSGPVVSAPSVEAVPVEHSEDANGAPRRARGSVAAALLAAGLGSPVLVGPAAW